MRKRKLKLLKLCAMLLSKFNEIKAEIVSERNHNITE